MFFEFFLEKIILWNNLQPPSKYLCEKRIHFVLFLRKWRPYVCASKFLMKIWKFLNAIINVSLAFFLKKYNCDILHNFLLSFSVKKELVLDNFEKVSAIYLCLKIFDENLTIVKCHKKCFLAFFEKYDCDTIQNSLLSVLVKCKFILDNFWENGGHMYVPQNFLTKIWNLEDW